MNGLKMMWLELDGQLVCRWVDKSEAAETVLRRLTNNSRALGTVAVNQPLLTAAKAA